MTVRVNGPVGHNRLGYFQGENALLTIVLKSLIAESVFFEETGVIASLEDFKKIYAFDTTAGIEAMVDHDGDGGTATVLNTSVEQRTFNGVVIASDAEYIEAYAKQLNLRRLVETIQQRAVVIGISKGGDVTGVADGGVLATDGYDADLSWEVLTEKVCALTVLIERGDVMDRYPRNPYGQISGSVEVGKELIDSVTGLTLLAKDGTEKVVEAANVAFKVSREIPQVL